ncbi:hypothetical protein JOB18_026322 [Solea senegalensis]|uniref:Uncharacterized protein n=1 Tax=Solea senegalensis TaxID=28829 RepID=A0AAV6RP37_SOLSE|nr:extensin-like [Solea senegalensis]KAG7507186.1 hypothetical protein JOB18_026322 [Solea senegalensis]
MVVYYPMVTIPLLGLVVALWLILCHFTKKHRETESWPPSPRNSASIYVIPMPRSEESTDSCEPYSQPADVEPPIYCSASDSPPPYTLEPPSYSESPPPYTDPPPFSVQCCTS